MIYIVSHFYLPISNPPANRMGHLVKVLVERYGKENVRVVTGRPNYPEGRMAEEYKWRLFKSETGRHGERIDHLYEIPAPFQGFLLKTIGYVSFALSVLFYFLFRRIHEGDLVLVTSGPVFPAYVIYFLSTFRKNLRYVVDVRDLSPQTVAGMGFVADRSLSFRILKDLSDSAYRRARKVIGVVEGIQEYLVSVTSPEKVLLIHNPVDVDQLRPATDDERHDFKRDHPDLFGDTQKTVFLFSGAHSVYMDLMNLMKALHHLKKQTDQFLFILIGYGEDKKNLQRFAAENGLEHNVAFLPHMERANLVKFICAADFCFYSWKDDPIFDMAISVKVLEYLACGKFVVGAHRGPFPEELRSNSLALISPPGDVDALAANLLDLVKNREHYPRMNPTARQLVIERFSASQFGKRILDLFADLVPPPPNPSNS